MTLCFSYFISLFISFLIYRTYDDYFIICTLGVQSLIFSIFNNCIDITNGPIGFSGIPSIVIGGMKVGASNRFIFLLISVFTGFIVYLIVNSLINSSFGRVLKAVGEDEIFVKSLGKNILKIKITSFTIGSVLASIAGFFYAHYFTHIDPSIFNLNESIFILSLVIIGGMGNLRGSLISVFVIIVITEFLRFFHLFEEDYAFNLRQVIYGLILIFMVIRNEK